MKKNFKKLAALFLSGVMAFTTVEMLPQTAREVSAYSTSDFSETEWEVLKIVNKERQKEGLDPLTMYKNIQKAAHVRTKELTTLFSHSRPNGDICFSALDENNCDYMMAAENIAMGQISPASVMASWMNSPGHRANILTGGLSHIGIGHYNQGINYWLQIFTGPCRPSSMTIANLEEGKILAVEKGTSIEDMNLAAKLTCRHGVSYLPVDISCCSGYKWNDTSGKIQNIKVSCMGISTSFPLLIIPKLSSPSGFQAVPYGSTRIKISWKPDKAIDDYCLEYSAKSTGPFKRVYSENNKNGGAILTGLAAGTRYYLRIAPMFETEGEYLIGSFSPLITAQTAPGAAKITAISNKTRGQLTLAWTRPRGASGYRVYYSPTKTGTYKVIATLSGSTKTSYTHKGLKHGRKGYYKIRPYVRIGTKNYFGPYSSVLYRTVK